MASFEKKILLLMVFLICCLWQSHVTGYTIYPGITIPDRYPVPLRYELRTFAQDPTRLTIYYLGLLGIQATAKNNPYSFYQIAGIHGTPVRWNGDNNGGAPIDNGYCKHRDPLFPTWHRPYLALYEAILIKRANETIQTFPEGTVKTRYLTVLQTWRIPYLDWGRDPRLPDYLNLLETVTIPTVQGGSLQTATVRNPLYSYPLDRNDLNTEVDRNTSVSPFTIQTVRNPTVRNSVYVSRPAVTNNNMVRAGPGLKNGVYKALTLSTDYISFSNARDGLYNLESPHDNVHGAIGGNLGHMAYVPFAAFDPIFYLHHANVDRLLALWQAMHPDQYLSNTGSPNANTPLYPFLKTQTQYWTSNLVRYVTDLGYNYDDLNNCNRRCATALANRLYGPSSLPPSRYIASGTYDEYEARIQVSDISLYGSFSINLYFGQPSNDGTDYTADDNYVDSFRVFTPSNLPKSRKKLGRGTVSLTAALYDRVTKGKLADMKLDTVKAYLKTNCKWTVTGLKNEGFDLDGLDITVVTMKTEQPKDQYDLPIWGNPVTVYKVV